MTTQEHQLQLFHDLPPPQAARHSRIAALWCEWNPWQQLPIPWVLRDLERDIDDDFDFPVHRVLTATEPRPMAPPRTIAPSSIFNLAATVDRLKSFGRFGDSAGFTPPTLRVHREGDRVRVVRLREDETEEWRERERIRRAKQRPPKPTKKAKTRGAKLMEMIGGDDGC